MTRLLLIRHGETDWNRAGRVLGRLPGNRLNGKGKREVAALADALAKQRIAAVYTGPLERATETAAILCQRLALPAPVVEEALTEVDAGDWAGKTRDDLAADPVWLAAHENPVGVHMPNGESLDEAAERALAAVQRLRERHRGKTFALVTHGDIIRSIVAHHMGLPLSEVLRTIFDTASVSVIEFKGDLARVIRCGWKANQGKLPLESAFGD
jgi:broad specificity phosphatase PhoE